MDPRLQRRIQRYGWDLAVDDYEPMWQRQLAEAQQRLVILAALQRGERVLDIACGTGLIAFEAARAVGPDGYVLGVDLSGRMVDAARSRAANWQRPPLAFERMDAERLDLPDGDFDVVLCSLGLMYVPDPAQALREMRRVLRPNGRVVVSVWGERAHCGWSPVFAIVDEEVKSEVCPLFFQLGQRDALAQACSAARFRDVRSTRLNTTLSYVDAEEACDAAFVGGPVALAWSRFDETVRERARARYIASIAPWRQGERYEVPGEFVIVSGRAAATAADIPTVDAPAADAFAR